MKLLGFLSYPIRMLCLMPFLWIEIWVLLVGMQAGKGSGLIRLTTGLIMTQFSLPDGAARARDVVLDAAARNAALSNSTTAPWDSFSEPCGI